uniref:CUE domain-containing protein n=2 Tax=Rhodosorus marinus TaxID=101924 RepID=A0A7S3A4Y4_9RHOD|mmetsp:Transcript_44984/g.174673  ORF Transcript_44984/g.174673 Transcript_44984/m.174673 type:complete len:218 (+) Transcript_44984:375-1028(+)|eukprot:CAMPEP_0113955676 /NCGR_PEP_ID=MMETSP0011_2-20120614/1513_1 /TAXON_ID=101924 /ORGANISM="Rhodosorus marinus" /LENGTH=217 /DNA_ID=CAMNT_0000965487 /DNA_START=159 /DNA_END=812 /DNA_ORIENTATION=- /assembly_acc=CAM_ASM_000156
MASFGEEEIAAVAAVVPGVSKERAKVTLEAFNGNVDRAVLHLVSESENTTTSGTTADSTPNQPSTGVSDPPPASNVVYDSGDREADERLEKQMQDDESFARSLQEEERRRYSMNMYRATGTGRPQGATTDAVEFGESLQDGFSSALTKAKEFGNATASKLGALYNSYMKEESSSTVQPERSVEPMESPAEQELGSFTESDYNTGANLRRETAQDNAD